MYAAFFPGIFAVICGSVTGVTLSPCGANNNTVHLEESRRNNTVVCNDILDIDYNVDWILTIPSSEDDIVVGACPANNYTCTNFSVIGYVATRTRYTSVMTIDPTKNVAYIRNGILACSVSKSGGPASFSSCQLNIVSGPDIVNCQGVQPSTTGSFWTVTGRCDIRKVYSYEGKYICQWFRQQGSSMKIPVSQPVSMRTTSTGDNTSTGGTYVDGVCEVTMPWSFSDDVYNYCMVFFPGGGIHDAGRLTIRSPSPGHTCPQYVPEGHTLSCMCAGDAGIPTGVFEWENNSKRDFLSVSNVNRTHVGIRYRCQAVWNGTVVKSAVYILNVSYGPDNVSATAPEPFDTNGSRSMTLTCSAYGVNPSPTFTWTQQNNSNVIHQGNSYTFEPSPPEGDGLMFQCRAQNPDSGVNRTATVTVRLNYPPTGGPIIGNSSPDGNLYEGDTVNLTCTVTGGKPVNATSVTLTCPGKQNSWETVWSTGVNSSVAFNPVVDTDHNSNCSCSTSWKETNWYTRKVLTTLFVFTPPSPPNITVVGDEYPPIANVTAIVTLMCASSTPGRPTANYNFTVTGGGHPSVDGEGRGTLTFGPMGKEDDGKTVTCRARNLYTSNKQPVADARFKLQVYYHPVITLSSNCHVTTSSTCEVTEGQKLNILCHADSNPAPETFKWHKDDGTGFSPVSSYILSIEAANHTIHNGKYNCTVTTGTLEGKGRRPLMSSQQLTVIVKYKPSKTQLTINTGNNISVIENDSVVFACLADGSPTPYMELKNDAVIVGLPIPEGDVTLEDGYTWLNHTLTAQCQHTGTYRCITSNSVGEGVTDTAMLHVNCKPRAAQPVPEKLPSVSFAHQAVQLSLRLVAYPLPHNFTFFYFGSAENRSGSGQEVVDNIFQMSCWSRDVVYDVTCSVTVDNITADRAGRYSVKVANDFGAVELAFEITFNGTL